MIFPAHNYAAELAKSALKSAKVKAAYIFNFPDYFSWPDGSFADDKSPFYICYNAPDNYFIQAVKQLSGEIKQHHSMQIIPFNFAQKNHCHILIMSGVNNDYQPLLNSISKQPVLTIADIRGFADTENSINGHIELIKKANRIRFVINTKAVKNSQLKVSSKLLKLAIIVADKAVDNGEKK